MKKSQLEHILRAAKELCQEDEFIIIGSQSLHGKYPDLPDEILVSVEADLIAKNNPLKTENLNSIGIDSPFHEMYGYYADPVDLNTATLPRDWKNRLVHLKTSSLSNGAKAYCLEPHDLTIAKIAAWREKDKVFVRFLASSGLVDKERLMKLVEKLRSTAREKERIRCRIESIFDVSKKRRNTP